MNPLPLRSPLKSTEIPEHTGVSQRAPRSSPVHDELEHLHPTWGEVLGMPVALHFGKPEAEHEQKSALGICDVSALEKLLVKGAGAQGWLESHGVKVPAAVYGHTFVNEGCLVVRTGSAEFFIEDNRGTTIANLSNALRGHRGEVYAAPRQDAGFVLSGRKADAVLAETCGVNFSNSSAQVVLTRVAGVSCSILKILPIETGEREVCYRVWCDGSYGPYLWETLLGIVREHGGNAIGASSFPQLFQFQKPVFKE